MFAINAFILALIACALGVLFTSREKGLGRLRDVIDILPLVKPHGLKRIITPSDPRFPRVQGGLLVSTLKTLGGMLLRGVTILLVAKHFGWQDQVLNETAIVMMVMTFMGYWHSANTALFMVRARKANPADPREAKLIEVYNEVLRDARKLERKELIKKYQADPKKAKQLQHLLSLGDDVPLESPWLLRRLRNVRDGINFVFDKLMPKMPEFQRRAFARFVIAIAGLNRLAEDPELFFFDGDSNAFASGPLPFMSVIAVSSDILQQWLPSDPDVVEHLKEFPEQRITRRGMKGVLAHERGHVARLDIMVNALMNLETVVLSMIVDTPVRLVTGFIRTKWVETLLNKLRLPDAAKALGLDWIMRVVGQVIQMGISQVQKIIPAFVTRSRESGADAYAAMVTDRPLDLAYSLKALRPFVMWRRESKDALRRSFLGAKFAKTYEEHRMESAMMALRPIMFIDSLYDALPAQKEEPAPQPKTGNPILDLIIRLVAAVKAGVARIRRAWDSLFYTHPSIETRIWKNCEYEFGKAGFCPVFTEPNPDQEF
ncbi:MAG: M48 family metalloprotease [Candidatus Obscuribacterales bacterium]|nr:M48 family metalloprotease [Candidatus Obscuribacterales bacterium]